MRHLLLFLSLLCCAQGVFAQAAPPTAGRPDSLAATQAAPDTAAAIHRLFAAKRKRQVVIGGATFGAAVVGLGVAAFSSQQASGGSSSGYGSLTSGPIVDGQGVAALAIGVILIPVALGETLLFGGWSRKQEQLTVAGWQQHTESRFLKRKLKLKYFTASPPQKQRS